jgi:sarcosine/dimethylglycine N-methyltransferase
MAERTEDVQAHWTRSGVLARIDAALTELEHDPQNLNPEILATLEHLHSGGLATTRRQANRVALSEDSRVLDVGCGIGGPARYLARTYGCRVDGIDLTPELIETGRVLTERCKLADRVAVQGQCARSTVSRPDLRRGLVPERRHEYFGQSWAACGHLSGA